jgi:hypothetical protein
MLLFVAGAIVQARGEHTRPCLQPDTYFDSLKGLSSLLTSSIFKSSLISKDTHDFLSVNKRSGVYGEDLA